MIRQEQPDPAFESSMFMGCRWSFVQVADSIPDLPAMLDLTAEVYADRAWFELGHLNVGEYCVLSGPISATFYKIEEDRMLCHLPDGRVGVYVHDDDSRWTERRLDAERKVAEILEGGPLNG